MDEITSNTKFSIEVSDVALTTLVKLTIQATVIMQNIYRNDFMQIRIKIIIIDKIILKIL